MQKRLLGLCLAGTLLVPATLLTIPQMASAVRPDDAKTYTLERVFTKGATDRYNLILKGKVNNPGIGSNVELVIDTILRETTKEIKDDVALVDSTFEKALITFGGEKQEVAFPKSAFKTDKSGRMWDVKIEDAASSQTGGSEQMITVIRAGFYPKKAVKVGENWEVVVSTPERKDKKDKEVVLGKGKASLVGTEKIASFDALKVKLTLEILLDEKAKTPLKFDGTALIDSVTGKMLTVTGTVDGELPIIGKGKQEVSLSLLKEEPIKDVRDKKPEVKK